MHVYLVRHGETFLASRGVHQSPNTPLSPRGKEQAETVAEYLRGVNPDLILTSGYTRAVETARVIGLHIGETPKVHELFYELIRPSSLHHKPLASIATIRYVLWSFLKRTDPAWRYEDAENYTDLCERARSAREYLESLSERNKTVVIVSHTVFIRVLLSLLCTHKMPGTLEMVRIFFGVARFPNAGIVHLEYGKTVRRSKTCAWRIIDDTPLWVRHASRFSPPYYIRSIRSFLKRATRLVGYTGALLFFVGAAALMFLIGYAQNIAVTSSVPSTISTSTTAFPVSVDPVRKQIIEAPQVDAFFAEHIEVDENRKTAWLQRVLGNFALKEWYQNLASLSQRVLVIQPGERKEQIAAHFGRILAWDAAERERFLDLVTTAYPVIEEGKFFPGTYSVGRDATPEEVAQLILDTFNGEVFSRYSPEVSSKVSLADALTIASLLEREAYDFNDMREISGVIWNRLFAGMRLQIDATLQYAKGTTSARSWWPVPGPQDKYIESPYNTYLHEGLPPTAIANPSLAAILAALNPIKTECMYYFHDKDSVFHCTPTYEEHVAGLRSHYGRGK